MKEKLEKIVGSTFGIAFILLFLFLFFSVVAFFGGAIMSIFGFAYESPWAVIKFFAWSALLELPLSAFAQALPRAMLELKKLSLTSARVLFVFLDTMVGFFIMFLLDQYMLDVAATPLALFVVSFLFSLCGVKEIGKTAPQNLEELKELYDLDDLDDLEEQENKDSNQ